MLDSCDLQCFELALPIWMSRESVEQALAGFVLAMSKLGIVEWGLGWHDSATGWHSATVPILQAHRGRAATAGHVGAMAEAREVVVARTCVGDVGA